MSLFTEGLTSTYRNHPQIQTALQGVVLLNFGEFQSWYRPPDARRSERVAENVGFAQAASQYRKQDAERQGFVDELLIKELVKIVCEGNIGLGYGQHTVQNLLDRRTSFDILVAVDSDYAEESTAYRPGTVLHHKLKHVIGFIIAELGECQDKPNVYSVNLICTRKVDGVSIKSTLLLGALLFCIRNTSDPGIDRNEAILELADGYRNMSGFVSYTKMGFNKNLTLSGRNCFGDYTNLPMSVDISRLVNDEIIARAAGSRPTITEAEDDSGLFNAKVTPQVQARLISLNNVAYKLSIDQTILRSPSKLHNATEEALLAPYIVRYGRSIQGFGSEVAHAQALILEEIKGEIQRLLPVVPIVRLPERRIPLTRDYMIPDDTFGLPGNKKRKIGAGRTKKVCKKTSKKTCKKVCKKTYKKKV
jgi:hypothetical protein